MNHIATEVAVVVCTATAAATGAITTDDIDVKMLMIPFIGSLLVSAAGFLLNPKAEDPRVVFGRALIALFVGVVCTQAAAAIWPSIEALLAKPLALMAFGGVASGVGYVISRPLFEYFYKQAPALSEKIGSAAIKKAGLDSENK